ncbi:MAG: ABC transporter permease subunit [bacterium]|nr:ABC transporter permease subunit [bacterium]
MFDLKKGLTIFQKEILDILRDKRTIISMIVVPILIIPILTYGVTWFAKIQMKKMMEKEAVVILQNAQNFPALRDALQKEEKIRIIENILDTTAAIAMLRDETAQAIIIIPQQWDSLKFTLGQIPYDTLQILSLKTKEEAQIVVNRLNQKIEELRKEYSKQLLLRAGMDAEILKPFEISQVDVSTPTEIGGKLLGMMLPYMLILLTLSGAMYPAMDLTAGEKERGTMETLLISPASRLDIVFGKFLTILTVSIVTALLTIFSIFFTSSGLFLTISEEIRTKLNLHIDFTIVATVLVLLIPLSATFSALLMTLSLLAKSYKEAQSYVSPMVIVTIFPAMMSMFPGVKTNLAFSLIPILNVSLLVKDAFTGTLEPLYLITAFFSSIVVAAIAMRICVVTFNKESVLFRI